MAISRRKALAISGSTLAGLSLGIVKPEALAGKARMQEDLPPPLFAPPPAAALIPAVDLPPIAGTADVKHHPATSAKHLSPQHFSGHTPHDSIAACEP